MKADLSLAPSHYDASVNAVQAARLGGLNYALGNLLPGKLNIHANESRRVPQSIQVLVQKDKRALLGVRYFVNGIPKKKTSVKDRDFSVARGQQLTVNIYGNRHRAEY